MLRENLKTAISSSSLIVKEIAAKSGVNKRTIDKWVGSEATEPKVKDLYKVCQTLGITIEWAVAGEKGLNYVRHLIANEGKLWEPPGRIRAIVKVIEGLDNNTLKTVEKMILAIKTESPVYSLETSDLEPPYITATPEKESFANVSAIDYDIVGIPYFGDFAATAAGNFKEMLDDPGEHDIRYVSRKMIKGNPKKYFCLLVKGTSMTKAGVADGDEVVLGLAEKPENGAIMLVSFEGKSTLKRVVIKKDKIFLLWEDGSGKKEEIKKEGYRFLGKLQLILKSEKKA
jgi:SOS-response transcriptional repressor LexA